MPPPLVSVVVPHRDDLVRLDHCLTALEAQTIDRDRFEIIVSDNGSSAGTEAVSAVIAGRASLTCVAEPGAGPTRNGGVALAAGEVLAFTDSDCVPAPGWLEAGLAALGENDLVGGAMTVADPPGPRTGAQSFELVFAFDNRAYVLDKGFSVTANLFCRREVFDAAGGFAAGTAEDMEWCRRATDRGYRLGYAADALVEHPPRGDWRALVTKLRRQNVERYALQKDSARGRLSWLAYAWLLPLSILAHAPKILRHPVVRSPHDRAAAMLTLARVRLWRFADAHRLLIEQH